MSKRMFRREGSDTCCSVPPAEFTIQACFFRRCCWANIWDEVILDLMGMGGDYKGLFEKPAPRKPPVPKFRGWRKVAVK